MCYHLHWRSAITDINILTAQWKCMLPELDQGIEREFSSSDLYPLRQGLFQVQGVQ
jgi:hypothetical protein